GFPQAAILGVLQVRPHGIRDGDSGGPRSFRSRIAHCFETITLSLRTLPALGLQAAPDVGSPHRSFDPHGTSTALPVSVSALRATRMVATIWSEHGPTIVQLSYSVKRAFCQSI